MHTQMPGQNLIGTPKIVVGVIVVVINNNNNKW